MAKRTIIFRADGGLSIGMGHFIRTLALAEMLNEHFCCIYATRQPTQYQIGEIEKVCHGRIDLPNDDSHFEQFLTNLKGDEIVVLDNYYFSTEYQKTIKAKGCKLVCIDDMHDKHYLADIVINHALTEKRLFSIEKYTKLFLGLEYALIRKEFFANFGEEKEYKSILLNMGGSDFNNLTSKILRYLISQNISEEYKVYVVVGNANKYTHEIRTLCKMHNFLFFKDLTAKDLSVLLERVEYAILPSSTILIEALYKGVKIIGCYFVDNQKEFFDYLTCANYIFPVGNMNNANNFRKIKEGLDVNYFLDQKKLNRHSRLLNSILSL
jgi:UDP-2,4-diacetamido-2,4,6-trideoxy-beta-L-altropyranose hydrolase